VTTLLFIGPTLAPQDVPEQDAFVLLPPVAQGDLYRAVRRYRPDLVGIVDGYFHQVPSVWHKEILWTLSQGIPVLGAASMGALRAAELEPAGMTGVGRIYQAFRSGSYPPYPDPFENDDEVAVLHGPPETGYLRLSDALVDLRQGLAEASEAGIIDAGTRDALAAAAAAMPYGERCFESVAAALGPGRREALRAWWAAHFASQKRRDALALVERLRALADGDHPPEIAASPFQRSSVWERFEAAEEKRLRDALSPDEALVVADLQLDPRRWSALARAAGRHRAEPQDLDERSAFSAWRTAHGLGSRAALMGWMEANGLDEHGLTALFRRVAGRGGADATAATPRDVVDHLMLTGRYTAALAEARARRDRLAARTAARRPADLSPLADRYGLAGSGFAPEPLAAVAARHGYPDLAAFEDALWRRHLLDTEGETS
jgi:hypothetical protein